MKKVFYTLWIAISIIMLTMCSKASSVEEEREFTESVFEGEKIVIDTSEMETELFGLVNDHRASLGLGSLESSSSSYKYAEEHNAYMISKNQLSHDNFESRASKIAAETNAVNVGENVARNYPTAAQVLDGWLKSSAHKEAIEGSFTHATLSIQLDKEGNPYFTQIFMKVE